MGKKYVSRIEVKLDYTNANHNAEISNVHWNHPWQKVNCLKANINLDLRNRHDSNGFIQSCVYIQPNQNKAQQNHVYI